MTCAERIQLRAAVRDDVLAHARAEAPRECCGLLVGRGALVQECVRSRNIDPDPNRYEVDPLLHIATSRRLRGSGREIVGAYHSHPHSTPLPSESDRAEAYYRDFIWMIVSLAVPERAALAAYRLTGEKIVELTIEVIP